ncbi:MAG: hypothetical protein ABGY75_05745, partial [Gemmataceae bacterium]
MPGPNVSEPYSIEFLEREYEAFRRDPHSVDPSLYWLFTGADQYGSGGFGANGHAAGKPVPLAGLNVEARLQTAAVRLINSYRLSGHLVARSNPLTEPPADTPYELDPKRFAVTDADLDTPIDGSMLFGNDGPITLRELLTALKETYCGSVGFEFMHVQSFDARSWLARQIEPSHFRFDRKPQERVRTLTLLRRAELFENFLQTKFLGKKRFGLEGSSLASRSRIS